jgi:hypothetical protein
MGKNKKKQEKGAVSAPAPVPETPVGGGGADGVTPAPESAAGAEGQVAAEPQLAAAVQPAPAPSPAAVAAPSRLRRWLPDLVKVALALAVIGVAAIIWFKPPLTLAHFPYVSYQFQGQTLTDAKLFRPLAMPTRYYVQLPKKLADRYEWFAVDRRREVVALTVAPHERIFGRDAIKRSDPLGLDLEFRKLDHSEWQVTFLPDAIVFSNAVLAVRMETRQAPDGSR